MAQDQSVHFQSFLGTGWSFPPTFDRIGRRVESVSDEKDIEQSLQIILSTSLGERVMQPRFGCNVRDYILEPLDASLKSYLRDLIETALLYYEPRIDIDGVLLSQSTDPLEGKLIVEIEYTVRGTNTRYNLVYPFYLSEAETGF